MYEQGVQRMGASRLLCDWLGFYVLFKWKTTCSILLSCSMSCGHLQSLWQELLAVLGGHVQRSRREFMQQLWPGQVQHVQWRDSCRHLQQLCPGQVQHTQWRGSFRLLLRLPPGHVEE